MALFFDQAWFDAELGSRHLTREMLGPMLGLSDEQVAEVWKDQRELKAGDVAILAALLNLPPETIALRAGVSTPVPRPAPAADAGVEARLAAIEAKLDAILDRLG